MKCKTNNMQKEGGDVEMSPQQSFSREQKKTIEEVREITEIRMRKIADYHGLEHTKLVVRGAHYLSAQEKVDPFVMEISAWLHDWGRVGEKQRYVEGNKTPHATISQQKAQRMLLVQLLQEGILNSSQYQRILEIVKSHSDLPGQPMRERKIIRDADRLSRFGVIGLNHLIIGAEESGIPFYVEGRPVVRERVLKPKRDVKCAIDDINYVTDWENILETNTAKRLNEKKHLSEILKEFLRTYAQYKDRVSEDVFKTWVSFVAEEVREKQNTLIKNAHDEGREEPIEELYSLENPVLLGEESFKKYLSNNGL